ncbi:DUF6284 family protein [Streptomyces wuyuanensis]|uniref:Uncharacterized protein n=1 Tax=Streptomyces wuyuanensis TaxID=1196353 RepID=A0A1G9V1B9_9ACTN|nr:DUF6284 family protein [Streptomyces wuyuanensis]SDM65919.1 hypothetical protein SAMN05444921_111163 [Streptomyces wuyuanensis]
MKHMKARQVADTAITDGREPTGAELDAIEREMPLIAAEVELLDAQIGLLDRAATALDERRIRRARNRVLAARRDLTNRTAGVPGGPAVA